MRAEEVMTVILPTDRDARFVTTRRSGTLTISDHQLLLLLWALSCAEQRQYLLREVFNGLRYIVKTGGQWRWMPHDLPP
jgi:transposase